MSPNSYQRLTFVGHLSTEIRRFWRNREGGALITLALALPVMCGITALAVDVGYWFMMRREAQTAVDAAAIDAAYQLQWASGSLTTAAQRSAQKNGFTISGSTKLTVNHPPLSGAYTGSSNAVEVYLELPQSAMLAAVLNRGQVTVKVRAVGILQLVGTACILALDTMASQAMQVWGNTTVNAAGCVLGSNSNSSSSIALGGSAILKAFSLWAHGSIYQGSNASVTLDKAAVSNATSLADPYSSLSPSVSGGCKATNKKVTVTETLAPGRYCSGISFGSQSVATLQPGTYYIDKGDFTVNGGATITCSCPNSTDGVTIILTSSGSSNSIGSVTINGGATVNLTAPSGLNDTYKGVLFFQDRNAPSNGTDKLNGGATMTLTGAVYFPSQDVQYNGGSSTSSTKCTQIIAKTVEFTGNSKIDNSGCSALGVKPVEVDGVVLAE